MTRQGTIFVRLLPIVGIGLLLTRFGGTLHAGPADTKPAEAPKFVTWKAGAAQYLNLPRTVEMSEGVTFGQDDATLVTDAAVALMDKEQNLVSAQAQGPVTITDPQDHLTGQHGSIDFTHHLAKLQDNIVLIVKPGKREAEAKEGSPRKQFKDPATLTCQIMTYDYRRKIGRVPGPLTVVQNFQTEDGPETRTLTADAGLYNGKAETIQLVGDIRVVYSDGSKLVADTRPSGKPVVIGTKEGEEYVKIPFPTTGMTPLKNQTDSGSSKDDSTDADLTVPPAPPAPNPGGAGKASTPPAAASTSPVAAP